MRSLLKFFSTKLLNKNFVSKKSFNIINPKLGLAFASNHPTILFHYDDFFARALLFIIIGAAFQLSINTATVHNSRATPSAFFLQGYQLLYIDRMISLYTGFLYIILLLKAIVIKRNKQTWLSCMNPGKNVIERISTYIN